MTLGNRRLLTLQAIEKRNVETFGQDIELIDAFLNESSRLKLASQDVIFYADADLEQLIWGREVVGVSSEVQGHDSLKIIDFSSVLSEVEDVETDLLGIFSSRFDQLFKNAQKKGHTNFRACLNIKNKNTLAVDYYSS